jgi:homoserine O-acetyltransferase
MLHTWDQGDVSRHPSFGGDLSVALAAIRAKTLLMPCETDRYFTVEDLRREVEMYTRGVAELIPLPSSWGHRAGDPYRPGSHAPSLNPKP